MQTTVEKSEHLSAQTFQMNIQQVEEHYQTDLNKGLTQAEAEKRLQADGKDKLIEGKRKTVFGMFIEQFQDFLIIVLMVAAIISGAMGETSDAILILVIVVVNAIIGVVQENKAENSMEALKKMTMPLAKVIRDGTENIIEAENLVVGDVVLLDAGDYVSADGRIFDVASLQIQESALTGESLPVTKDIAVLSDPETSLGDRVNMVYMSSLVTFGRGKFVVTKTGMNTEIGKIAGMLQTTETVATPLQKKLNELGKILAIGALIACGVIFATDIFRGKNVLETFLVAVSLAVAAIPEGLPAIVTVVLALGTQRLVEKNAIVRKLPAVETLGSASVICSDKTGTLTQNKMTIVRVFAEGEPKSAEDFKSREDLNAHERLLTTIGMLSNDASINEENGEWVEIGDPTEVAFVAFSKRLGIDKEDVLANMPRVGELPFDSDRKLMTTLHQSEDIYYSFTKGAPDEIINLSTHYYKDGEILPITDAYKETVMQINTNLGDEALRVLGLAYKPFNIMPKIEHNSLEQDLVFVGLMGMIDPPREEVKLSIKECHEAGIHTVMITGDHKNTAIAIAKDLNIYNEGNQALSGVELEKMSGEELMDNIEETTVYARVSPEHKVRIVDAWQKKSGVVAMTGDGVNDAPALKKADIGCAMGITGTDVSKEASDIVLTDDNFATIVSAVKEGRGIFENIRKAVHFLLSCNIAEILIIFTATILNWERPLLPTHILWINLVTDSLPALALGMEKASSDIMSQKPRDPKSSIFADGLGSRIVLHGVMLTIISLGVFYYGYTTYGVAEARTMIFAVLGLSQLTHVLNAKAGRKTVFTDQLFENKFLWGAIGISGFLQLIVVLLPFTHSVFSVTYLNSKEWLIVAAASFAPLIIVELGKLLIRPFRKEVKVS
ncbi:MAG: calcium-translocating P-type ATPase, PMCA-type [Eubacteriaceae bacterium]|nr:calcium-translocating P-type ATPase, PMCA-type [Eubacteriaceae bacterium]